MLPDKGRLIVNGVAERLRQIVEIWRVVVMRQGLRLTRLDSASEMVSLPIRASSLISTTKDFGFVGSAN
jgi:hypothetical protein